MAARRLVQHKTSAPKTFKKLKDAIIASLPVHVPVTALQSKEQLHAYIHATITQNLPYYKALVRYQCRRNSIVIYTSSSHYKNLRLYYRLTEKGLCLLKTQFAVKPKSPV